MAFSAAARRKAKETQAANRVAKTKEVIARPAVQLSADQSLAVISKVAEHGDLLEACKAISTRSGATFADVMLSIQGNLEWRNALDAALTTFGQRMARKAMDVADEPIPWDEIAALDIEEKKLFLTTWAKRQSLRVETMRGYADRVTPKAPSGPAAVVNVDARKSEGSYAAMLQTVEAVERQSKVIEHKEDGDG